MSNFRSGGLAGKSSSHRGHRPGEIDGEFAGDQALKMDIDNAHKEVERLNRNRVALFEVMSDMIFLIRGDFVIEYMNASAIATFGDIRGRFCHDALGCNEQPCPECPVERSRTAQNCNELFERKIGEVYVEYNYVAFQGYMGEQLVMVVMRDISRRKKQEAELSVMHSNIETVLQQKIEALNESEKVRQELSREVNVLKRELDRFSQQQDEMVGESRKLRELRELIHHVADSDATILITGESGTGKELVADIIHRRSGRKDKAFLKFNCAAVAESLLESDLFGYERGAFTGATGRRMGKFEVADNGTIFLDEIGDISPRMQAALLRVLQNGEIVRVGGNEAVSINVRVIAATNSDLATAVEEKRFRRDLYYRLNVINIHLPPLRERREDIVPLISHFIKKYRAAFKKEIDYLPNRIIDRLLQYDWPGNVRELENVIRRAVLLAKDNVITEKELAFEQNISCVTEHKEALIEKRMLEQPLKDTLSELEAKILATAVDRYEGNPQVVTRILGLGKTTFYEKMKRYGLIPNKK
ncbi:MAG TPA: AAA family ATPase [Desulfurivibrio alkaliphilus]|uniref:AAA family ATPase n=1 Tax=Desulfurivibrio alkaliphilus TaxID=427923 RepID=A0A7C2TL39_9BACT|nr:AAA family ATPase [Desulfurivibrio alkaliphilus]